jgi:hypothetical protein
MRLNEKHCFSSQDLVEVLKLCPPERNETYPVILIWPPKLTSLFQGKSCVHLMHDIFPCQWFATESNSILGNTLKQIMEMDNGK